jgi:hypothetical protein
MRKFGRFGRDLPEHATLVLEGDWHCQLISGASLWSRAGFQWGDPFMLNEHLIEDDRMVRDAARAYSQMREFIGVTSAHIVASAPAIPSATRTVARDMHDCTLRISKPLESDSRRKDHEAMLEQSDAEVTL